MKDDHVTKEDLKEALEETSKALESKMEEMGQGMEERITERVITAITPMFEHLENQISAIAELVAPNAERPIRNEERLDQHETILERHDVEIKVLQQTK